MTKKEFVAMSLPYGLKVIIPETDKKYCRKTVIGTVGVVFDDGSINCYDTVNACPRWYKPILVPYSKGLTEYIKMMSFRFISEALKKHYDIAGLIEKGQAIDVISLKVNPYKKK